LPFKSVKSESKIGFETTYNIVYLESLSFFISSLDASQSRVYAVSMPCRDKSESQPSNLRKMGLLQPSHPCRVPARKYWPTINLLILIAKFCENRIFTPGQDRHNPGTESAGTCQHATLDRVYGEATSARVRSFPAQPVRARQFSAIFGVVLRG
jgi:hypothetical protein